MKEILSAIRKAQFSFVPSKELPRPARALFLYRVVVSCLTVALGLFALVAFGVLAFSYIGTHFVNTLFYVFGLAGMLLVCVPFCASGLMGLHWGWLFNRRQPRHLFFHFVATVPFLGLGVLALLAQVRNIWRGWEWRQAHEYALLSGEDAKILLLLGVLVLVGLLNCVGPALYFLTSKWVKGYIQPPPPRSPQPPYGQPRYGGAPAAPWQAPPQKEQGAAQGEEPKP